MTIKRICAGQYETCHEGHEYVIQRWEPNPKLWQGICYETGFYTEPMHTKADVLYIIENH